MNEEQRGKMESELQRIYAFVTQYSDKDTDVMCAIDMLDDMIAKLLHYQYRTFGFPKSK